VSKTRACQRCGAALSRYNADPVCACCTGKIVKTPRAPAWLWDSEPLRQAFVRHDLGAALAIIRIATGLSQLELATVLGWSQSAVARAESGQRDTLYDIRVLIEVADALDIPRTTLIPIIMGGGPHGTDRQQEEEFDMSINRRELGGTLLGLAAAAGLGSIQVPVKADAAHIRYFSASIERLYAQDLNVGSGSVARDGLRLYFWARRMLNEANYTEAIGRQLMSVAGEIAVCVGWLCYDADDRDSARNLYSEAHLLANQAGNNQLAIKAMEKIALQLIEESREQQRPGYARQAVAVSKRAAELARFEPHPQMHALLASREAMAQSMIGDNAAFERAVARAWREIENGANEEIPGWLKFVNDSEVAYHEACGRWNLGERARSINQFQEMTLRPDLSPRNEASQRAVLATALAANGDLAGAFDEGAAVLPALSVGKIRSARTLSRLRTVRQLAAHHPAGGQFREQYDQLLNEDRTI